MLRSAGFRIVKIYGDCSDRFDLESDSVDIGGKERMSKVEMKTL